MLLLSLLFLLLSPASIVAGSVPRADNTKTYDQRDDCLSYTGLGSAMITFNDPQENHLFDYAVVTKYTTYYPNTLAHALTFNGYKTLILDNGQLCSWQKLKSVHGSLGLDFHNHRGDIYWKHGDPAHVPSSNGQTPSQGSIDRISKILINDPPAGDVYMFCTIILAWTTSLLSYILFMILLIACIKKADRDTDESRDTEADEGIELNSIKASSGDSLAGTTAAATPFDHVKCIYASPQSGFTTSTDTTHSDYLPTYSRQEIGYGATFDNVRLS